MTEAEEENIIAHMGKYGCVTSLEVDSVRSWAFGAIDVLKDEVGDDKDIVVGYLLGLARDKSDATALAIDRGRGVRMACTDEDPLVADVLQ